MSGNEIGKDRWRDRAGLRVESRPGKRSAGRRGLAATLGCGLWEAVGGTEIPKFGILERDLHEAQARPRFVRVVGIRGGLRRMEDGMS